ncbi:MAG: tRNA pseudouridine(13) synthase TruD [Phycisphaerales bacterium]
MDQRHSPESSDTPDPLELDLDPRVEPCVYLTADIPPVGGVIKQRPEDFFVEELPAYEPSGSGEHIYLFIEKRDISTMHAVQAIARHFGVRVADVGYAGLKDKVAVTRQLVSVHTPGKKPADFQAFEHPRIGILWADLHANKLRQGHLAGNRFVIRIRGTDLTRAVSAHRALMRLHTTGVPNRIGEQRFGNLLNNHLVGRALLLKDHQLAADLLLGPNQRFPEMQPEARALYAAGKYDESLRALPRNSDTERRVLWSLAKGKKVHHAVYNMGLMPMRFFVTAFQSAVFNRVLDQRLGAGTLGELVEGDLAWKHDNGAVFAVDRAVLDDPTTRDRLDTIQISPSGPMWGDEMPRPADGSAPATVELAALESFAVTPRHLIDFSRKLRDPLPGKRRPLRVPLSYPDVEGGTDAHGHYVKVVFELPAGSFATVVLRELMKPDLAPLA